MLSTTTCDYQISVKNATDRPITIWLVKEGPPVEGLAIARATGDVGPQPR